METGLAGKRIECKSPERRVDEIERRTQTASSRSCIIYSHLQKFNKTSHLDLRHL